jgi:hypothetical protein
MNQVQDLLVVIMSWNYSSAGEKMDNVYDKQEPVGGDFLCEMSEESLYCIPLPPMSADQVRTYREQLGLSVEKFAIRFGLTAEAVERLESS